MLRVRALRSVRRRVEVRGEDRDPQAPLLLGVLDGDGRVHGRGEEPLRDARGAEARPPCANSAADLDALLREQPHAEVQGVPNAP